jgi:O-antigen ligase
MSKITTKQEYASQNTVAKHRQIGVNWQGHLATGIALLLALPWLSNVNFGPSGSSVQWLIAWIIAAASTPLLLGKGISDQTCKKSFVLAWIIAAVLSAFMALAQYLGQTSSLGGWVQSSEIGQAYANLRQRNQLATLLNMGLFSLLWLSTQPGGSIKTTQILILSCAAVVGSACAATGSRTGLFQFLLLAIATKVFGYRWRIMAVALLAYLTGAVLLPHFIGMDSFSSGILSRAIDNSATCHSRLALWSNVLHLIAQKPWLGWGWGELDYAHFVTLYPGERFCEILDNAHNLPLHLAVELGAPLAILACGAVGWLVWRAKPWADTHPTRQLAWVVLAVIGLHSLVEYPLWYGPFQVTVVLCMWMLYATPAQPQKRKQNMAPSPIAIAWIATILIALCTFVAWDYWRISQIYTTPEHRNSAYRVNTLAKIQGSWLFKDQVRFAELATTELTAANAQHVHELALGLLHFSPEPRVVEKLIESTTMLGNDSQAVYYLQRFKAAYPNEYQVWKVKSGSDRECCQ